MQHLEDTTRQALLDWQYYMMAYLFEVATPDKIKSYLDYDYIS